MKRQATTKVKVSPSNFAILKHQFLDNIRSMAMIDEIPQDIIINWDQTGVKYVPVSNWTMEVKGSKRVEVAGVDDKRQITALLSITMSGKLLPVQVVYKGKTPACLPKVPFPDDWHVTFTTNHWSNEETMMGYQWLVNACAYVEATDIIRNGFRETGITDVIQDTIQPKE